MINGLPIGFDRIWWKHDAVDESRCFTVNAYRLASIGLVGNVPRWRTVVPAPFGGLPIGFDRISWKLHIYTNEF